MASESHKSNSGLLTLLAAALAVAAIVSVVTAVATDAAAIGITAGAISAILAGAVVWLNRSNAALSSELRSAEHEIIRLESTVVDKVAGEIQGHVAASDTVDVTTKPASTGAPVAAAPAGLGLGNTSDLADSETGLLGERYFIVTLDARIAAARRHLRPLALLLIEGEKKPNADKSKNDSQLDAKATSEIVRETLRDADTLCRLDDGQFAVLLEDTPENGAIWTVERIRRRLNEQIENVTIWAGIACYPANGFDGPEVLDRARHALTQAREWQQDRTEVAEA